MNNIIKIFFLLVCLTASLTSVNASFGGIFDEKDKIGYCQDGECGIKQGIEELQNIKDFQTEKPASVYIQDIVGYILGFLWIVAVLYIIYWGFMVLTSAGEDEKVEKAKKLIVHALLGLVIIFLAYSIVKLFFSIL